MKANIKSRNYMAIHAHNKTAAGPMKDHKKESNKKLCRAEIEERETGEDMSEKISEFDTQNKPTPNESEAIWELVIADMKARDNTGFKKYGTRLQAFNGRNSSLDLYEELLDAVVYMKQQKQEKKTITDFLKEVSKLSSGSPEDKIDEISFKAYTLLKQLGEA